MKKMNDMKTTLLLTAALAVFAAVTTVSAAESLHSPKGKALADSLRKVPIVHSDVDLTKVRPLGNAKAWELARSFRSVPSTAPSVNLAYGPRPLLSPKDPRYETALRELRAREFQIAPLK
jgi:hypothetical protein